MEKLLPFSIEAESAVLGSLIIDPDAIGQVEPLLKADDFYRDAHRCIYAAMVRLSSRRVPADFITLCDLLERDGSLEDCGGASYITSLINIVPTSANAEHYARLVAHKALCRRLVRAAGQVAALAYDETEDAATQAEALIFAATQMLPAANDPHRVGDLLSEVVLPLTSGSPIDGAITGVPTGLRALDEATGGLQPTDLILLAGRPGMGKCLPSWTLIDNPETGERLTIEECVKRRMPKVLCLSESGEVCSTPISHWIDSGVKMCYRVRTRLGRMIEATEHHPFLTVHGWVPLHQLRKGSHIGVPVQVERFGNDESWSLDMVRLLAYFIAEGGLTKSSPVFTNTDPIIVEDFKQIIATHFPELHIRQHRIGYAVSYLKNTETMKGRGCIFPKSPVTVWLTTLGLMGKLAQEKFFPACVWCWSKRYLAVFIRTLMSCDGCIYAFQGSPIIEFTVASERLARDMQHALTRFGIIAKFCQKTQKAWRIEITQPAQVQRYQQEIGWFGEKSRRFAGYKNKLSKREGNNGHAPQQAWEIIHAELQRHGISMIELARRSGETTKTGHQTGYNPHVRRSIPRYRLVKYGQILDHAQLKLVASSSVYWDEIVSIEPIGEHHVYDLTVPEGANFIAQDVFVHNSSLSLTIARHAAMQYGRSVLFFSIEMSRTQLLSRLLAMEAHVDLSRLWKRHLCEEEIVRLIEVSGAIADALLFIDDTSNLSISAMRSTIRRHLVRHPLDLIVVDYLQKLTATYDTGKRYADRVQEVSEVARGLKQIAREFGVPVLALAQLSRAVESRAEKIPQLSDLRDSGELEQEADIVLFLYRDDYYAGFDDDGASKSECPGIAELIFAKYRNGPQGAVTLGFEARETRFYTLEEA
jgi:replicative DNA helicase